MKRTTLLLTILTLILAAEPSLAALNAYLRLEGAVQGEIKGGVTQAGREDSILVIGFSHEVTAPRDAATGLPTGRRSHGPIKITKEIDKATPLLMQAMTNNESLHGTLRFWEPSSTGVERQYYTIEIKDARIAGIRQEMLNNKYPENMQHKEREHISLVYGTITKTYEDGGITAEDEWSYYGGSEFISDLNGDGFVNFWDLAVMADEWTRQGRF